MRRAPEASPSMELRKIQLTGGASFTVTLPKRWVERAKLRPGDLVGFAESENGGLAVVPHAKTEPKAARIELEIADEDAEAAFRKVVSAYLAGYDVVVVRSKRPLSAKVRRGLQDATRRIIGLEITDEEPTTVTLQDFMDPREFHIEKALRRMQAITRAMQEDALRSAAAEEPFETRDDEVDRLYWMINKQFHTLLRDPAEGPRMGLNANQALNYLLVARLVERTADHARRIAENLSALREGEIRSRLESRIERQARRAFAMFADATGAFHRRDSGAANAIIEDVRAFGTTQDALIRDSLSLGGEDMLHVAYVLESVARTAAYASDIAETAINHAVAMEG